ncbi:MAG: tRNA pseudouridine(38-40) synthase TruA [Deferribacteraceae bacterium]|nr:tRNA pseudouridine(38-40) synthase TruA [Deferribacteraceae bacterium]
MNPITYYKKCICEYNGTAYSGWQFQYGQSTVQGEIEAALKLLYGERISTVASGRTDAGVHALAQVFSFSTNIYRSNHAIAQALNSMLPRDIAILRAEDAEEGFNAQFCALHKTYKYMILNRQSRAALEYDRMWFRRDYIDVDRMNALLQVICGTHDFSAFCVAKSLKENCVRTVNFAEAHRDGEQITVRVNASGFLHNMVRIIVGTAVDFSIKKMTEADMKNMLDSRNRRRGGVTAPAQGLYLEEVFYD